MASTTVPGTAGGYIDVNQTVVINQPFPASTNAGMTPIVSGNPYAQQPQTTAPGYPDGKEAGDGIVHPSEAKDARKAAMKKGGLNKEQIHDMAQRLEQIGYRDIIKDNAKIDTKALDAAVADFLNDGMAPSGMANAIDHGDPAAYDALRHYIMNTPNLQRPLPGQQMPQYTIHSSQQVAVGQAEPVGHTVYDLAKIGDRSKDPSDVSQAWRNGMRTDSQTLSFLRELEDAQNAQKRGYDNVVQRFYDTHAEQIAEMEKEQGCSVMSINVPAARSAMYAGMRGGVSAESEIAQRNAQQQSQQAATSGASNTQVFMDPKSTYSFHNGVKVGATTPAAQQPQTAQIPALDKATVTPATASSAGGTLDMNSVTAALNSSAAMVTDSVRAVTSSSITLSPMDADDVSAPLSPTATFTAPPSNSKGQGASPA